MRMRPALTTDDAHIMLAAAKAEAAQKDWKVSIAIVDDAGYLVLFERLEGAGPSTADVALGKARAAAITRQPTKDLEARVKDRPSFIHYPYPNSVLIQGALPIMHGGECVGAIGMSGRPSHEDEHLCSVAIAALGT